MDEDGVLRAGGVDYFLSSMYYRMDGSCHLLYHDPTLA